MNDPIVCYEVPAQARLRCTMCGTREPEAPFHQARRVRRDFVSFLVVKGRIQLTDFMPAAETVAVGAGEIHTIAPGFPQASSEPFAPGIRFLWFHFLFDRPFQPRRASQLPRILDGLFRRGAKVGPQLGWLIPRHQVLAGCLDSFAGMHRELVENTRLWGVQDGGSRIICEHMVYAMHREFLQEALGTARHCRGQEFDAHPAWTSEALHVARVRHHVRLNLHKPLSVAELAAELSLHPSYLSRVFRRATGLTVVEFIQRTRLDLAKTLLREGSASVKEVAFQSGFQSSSYFCRIFRACEGLSPLQFARGPQG